MEQFVITYDKTLDDGAVKKHALFFGYDLGVPFVLEDGEGVKLFDVYADALSKLPIAAKVGRSYTELSAPKVVLVPNG